MKNLGRKRTILIDGFNLGLEKGTGIATYGRNLSRVCRDSGDRVDILYGMYWCRPSRSQLLREISFFDAPHPNSFWPNLRRDVGAFVPHLFGVPSFEVPITGEVVRRAFAARLPDCDHIFNATNLWRIAEVAFGTRGAFTKVRHPAPVDVAHWTYPLPVRIEGAKNVYTIHDLVPLRLPYTTLDDKNFHLKLVKKIVEKADHIVTVSQTSRADIVRMLGCPEDKVSVTYQSVSIPPHLLAKSEEQARAEVTSALGLPWGGYFLYFGAIEPKKNVGRLIEAHLASGVEEPLVVIGSRAWKSEDELRFLDVADNAYLETSDNRTHTKRRVHVLDWMPFSLLVSAIRGAKATAFPSLWEGFGLPVLESMLLGTPVVTSREGATAEIASDAALLIDPYDTADLAAAIRRLSHDADLRRDLAERGRRRAEDFSPERHAERIAELHDRLLGESTVAASRDPVAVTC